MALRNSANIVAPEIEFKLSTTSAYKGGHGKGVFRNTNGYSKKAIAANHNTDTANAVLLFGVRSEKTLWNISVLTNKLRGAPLLARPLERRVR